MFFIKDLGLELQKIYQKIIKKLLAIKGNPKSIAKGFATGVAMSFTPFVGFHILLSLIITTLTKQNKIASTLGTIAGNPWTFPFIWYLTLHLGIIILDENINIASIDFKIFFSKLYHAVISLDFDLFISDILPIFIPMLIGSIPCYIVVWIVVYHLIYKVLKNPNINNKGKIYDTRNRL